MRRTKWVSAVLAVSMVFASLTGTVFAAEDPTVPDETGMVFAVKDLPEDEGLEKDEDLTNNQPADVEETTDDSIQLLNEPVELKPEYHSDYTVEFNGFEQTPSLEELLSGIDDLPADAVEITRYENNTNATSEGNFACAVVQGINGTQGSAKIYFTIEPFKLAHATVLKKTIKQNVGEDVLANVLAIDSAAGRYIIPSDCIALRQLWVESHMVDQGGWPATCYYMGVKTVDLSAEGSYQNATPNKRNRYYFISTSPNFAVDDSAMDGKDYWDFGTSSENRNIKYDELVNSFNNTYKVFTDDMSVQIGTFTNIARVDVTIDSFSYPDYDDGEISLSASTGTAGVTIEKAVCKLVPNTDVDSCKATYLVEIFFSPKDSYLVPDGALLYYGAEAQSIVLDEETQWYKATFTSQAEESAHQWVTTEHQDATCTEDGADIQQCTHCGVKKTQVLDKLGHEWQFDRANDDDTHTLVCTHCKEEQIEACFGGTATCSSQAVCDVCKEGYGALDPRNHTNVVKVEEKSATEEAAGNIAYWYCDGCNKYFSDEGLQNEISQSDTIIAKLPVIVDGAGQSWEKGGSNGLTFTSDAEFGDLIQVLVDETAVDDSCYTVKEGSTVVTLKASYLNTLSAGEHTLAIVSKNGTAKTTFTVTEKSVVENPDTENPESGKNETQTNPSSASPKTGDDSHLVLWIAFLLISGMGATGVTLSSKKRKANQ